MFILCDIAAANINQRRVFFNQSLFDQFSNPYNAIFNAAIVDPSSAPSQSTMVLINIFQHLPAYGVFQGHLYSLVFKVFHIMGAFPSFSNISFTGASEGFYGIDFAFLHFSLRATLYYGDRLACMHSILVNRVPTEISNTENGFDFAINFNLVALHDFLDGFSDIAKPHINPRLLNTSHGRVFDSFEERKIPRVERNGEGAVYQKSVEVNPEVDLADIVFLENLGISIVRGIVGRDVV